MKSYKAIVTKYWLSGKIEIGDVVAARVNDDDRYCYLRRNFLKLGRDAFTDKDEAIARIRKQAEKKRASLALQLASIDGKMESAIRAIDDGWPTPANPATETEA